MPEGTIFALLGPNGAGNTTMVQILSTLLRLDAGEVSVAGFDLRREANAIRGAIGVTGQFSAVDTLLTYVENVSPSWNRLNEIVQNRLRASSHPRFGRRSGTG